MYPPLLLVEELGAGQASSYPHGYSAPTSVYNVEMYFQRCKNSNMEPASCQYP